MRLKLAQDPGATKTQGKDAEKAQRKLASDEKKIWAKEAYFARFGNFSATYQAMRKLLGTTGLSAADITEFYAAECEVGVAQKAQDWSLAKAKLDHMEAATLAIKQAYDAGKQYFDAFALIEANLEAGRSVYRLRAANLAVQNNALDTAYSVLLKATDAKDWVKAEAALPALDAACTALKLAGVTALADKPGFELAFKGVLDLAAAQAIAKAPPLTLVEGEVKAFNKAFAAVNDAKNSGDFKPASDAISALKTAISKLIEAKNKVVGQALVFKQELAKIAGHANAQALATTNSPAVTDQLAAFTDADGKVNAQVKQQDWAAATPLLGPLEQATRALLEAKVRYNTGCSEPKRLEFQQQMIDLKPRTDPAKTPGPSTHVDKLKTVVKERLGLIESALSSADPASAEMLLLQLLGELGALDLALAAHQQHVIKFNAAKNGAVKLALDCVLAPKKLADERTSGLTAMGLRIELFADKGSIATKADPMVGEWIQQADAWQAAQAASDNLNSGSDPDPIALRALEGLPGGGNVLEALVAGLPDGKPEKFIHQLFCKVPTANVMGKVNELIQFDENALVAAAGGGKIWMYCGLPEGGSKQKFGSKAGVVADGEAIDPNFLPVNEDEVAYFDFAALHEVGHAVDQAKGITSYQFRAPGEWFAELYAAYFSGKHKKDHPYASWLKPLKKIT